jgi:hypothetical protein
MKNLFRYLLVFVAAFALSQAPQEAQAQGKIFFHFLQTGSAVAVPSISVAPVVTGSTVQGSVLTTTTGTWTGSPSSYAYRWFRNGVAIGGETASTYTSVAADAEYGVTITSGVIATNVTGSSTESISNAISVVVNPTTIATKYWSADNSYQDDLMTTPSANGNIVLTIREQIGAVHNLDWIGTIVGAGVEKQNDNDYGDTQPYPIYRSAEGGFVHIRNSTPKKYETQGGSLAIAGASVSYYFVRLTGGTDNEYFFFTSNGGAMRDRDTGTGTTTQLGAFNTLASLTTGGRVLTSHVYKTVFFEIVRDGSGNAQLYVNGSTWGENIAVGSNDMAEFAFGSNSHNANIMNFAGSVISGARDAVKSGKLRKLWESKHGVTGTYSPLVATFDGGGSYDDQETWNTGDKSINAPSYTFRSAIGATEGATEFRLYTSSSSTQATAIAQRTYVKTKVRGVDANPGKFIRGTDYGVSAGTPTNVFYWIEVIAVDQFGNRQVIETQTQGINDSQSMLIHLFNNPFDDNEKEELSIAA